MAVPQLLQPLVKSARLKHFPRGQIILYEGDTPSDIFIIKEGAVKIYDINEQGNEKILHIVRSPALLPFAFFSGDSAPLHWFYSTLTDCDLYVLPRAQIRNAMKADGELTLLLMRLFSADVHELLVRLSSLEKTNARDKLIASLKFLAVRHAYQRRSGWWRVSFAVNHQLLADMSGITRESASTVMKELQDEKVVRSPRLTILEIDQDKLVNTK